MEKKMVLDAIYGVSQARSSVNPVTLVQSWRRHLPDLEENVLQGFSNEEIRKSEILDMVCVMRSFENINKETLKNGYSVSVSNELLARQTLTVLPRNKREKKKRVGKIREKFMLL
jgi:hypothetical protein